MSPGSGRPVDLGALSPAMTGFWTERHLCTLTTLRSDGTPHVVPVGVVLDPLEGLTDASSHSDYLSVMRANLTQLEEGQPCP